MKCNNMFFLKKKDGNLRKIISCDVGANMIFTKSPQVHLPGPWQFKRLRVRGGRFYVGDADVSNFFTRLGLFSWMLPFFAVQPIMAGKVMTDIERKNGLLQCPITNHTFKSTDLVCPVYTRVAMGWTHAVYLTVEVLQYKLSGIVT